MLFSSFFLASLTALAAASPIAVSVQQKRTTCPGATAWSSGQIQQIDTTDIHTGVKTRKTVASVYALCPLDKAATVTFEILNSIDCNDNITPLLSLTNAFTVNLSNYNINYAANNVRKFTLACGEGNADEQWMFSSSLEFNGLIRNDVLKTTAYRVTIA